MTIGNRLISEADRKRLANKARVDPEYLIIAEEIDNQISDLEQKIDALEQQKREKFKEVMIRIFMDKG